MINRALKFFQKLNEIPDELSSKYPIPEFYRSYVWVSYACILGGMVHLFFIPLFAAIGVTALALFNILSVTMWIIALKLHRSGHFVKAYLTLNVEVVAHGVLCVFFMGWSAGFQYYLLLMPTAAFLGSFDTVSKRIEAGIKIGAAAVHCFSFILLYYYSSYSPPLNTLSAGILNALNWVNIVSVCALMSFFSYSYALQVKKAEEKVELEHRRTTRALEERNEALMRLNQELAEAAEYVRTMLPKPITAGDIHTDWRFIPSTSLGGDAFGYHWLDEADFAIYLIDVSGHGVGAALLSASVVNVLRSQSLPNTDFKNPEQVLESLNTAFPSEENNDMFFTIWYGVYNNRTRELTYASGGHPPALILRRSDSQTSHLTELKTPNYVIGGMPDSKYVKHKCKVAQNSTLYVFSDGCYEVEKADGSMWRFDEFLKFVARMKTDSQENLDTLYLYEKDLSNADHLLDDFTILEVAFG